MTNHTRDFDDATRDIDDVPRVEGARDIINGLRGMNGPRVMSCHKGREVLRRLQFVIYHSSLTIHLF